MLTIMAPPSKSVSHRMLMGAALAQGQSEVHHVLLSKDLERTRAVLSAAGAVFTPLGEEEDGAGNFVVQGMGGRPQGAPLDQPHLPPLSCDMHESGTSCRLLTAILAAGQGRFRIHGATRLHQRPIGRLVTALQNLGVGVTYEEKQHCPPLLLETTGFGQDKGASSSSALLSVNMDLDESSQYLSGLLLAAPCSPQGLCIALTGTSSVSWPYVGLTLQALEDFGIAFHVEARAKEDKAGEGWQSVDWRSLRRAIPGTLRFHVHSSPYRAGTYQVEGDWSGASYFLAAGAVGPKPLLVQGLRPQSLQGDRAMLDILIRMGAEVQWQSAGVCVSPAMLHGIDVDMGDCPDLVPTVAMLAAFAHGSTTVRNVAHLRIKESDRIAAPAAQLRKVGVQVDEHADGLTVHGVGQAPKWKEEQIFEAHGDHRMAMSTALLGLHGQYVRLDHPEVVNKSFPHFWKLWSTLGGGAGA